MKDSKALSKIMVRLEVRTAKLHPLHHQKRNRILKRAVKVAEKLNAAISKRFPLMKTTEVNNLAYSMIKRHSEYYPPWMALQAKGM